MSLIKQFWSHGQQWAILLALAVLWEAYGRFLGNELVLPSLSATLVAFKDGFVSGELPAAIWTSLRILVVGYLIGLVGAGLLTTFAMASELGRQLLVTLTAMLNPLPAVALLPVALLWFGIGEKSLIFVIVHSVLWSVSLNAHSGFRAVSPTQRMAGHNLGLRGFRYVALVLVPAAFPAILTGLKIGWAFGWRTLIASELVFGASSRQGGLGWFIFEHRNELDIPDVFAGLLSIVLIGFLVEGVLFRLIEARTVKRWGMA
ncbi:MAG TPA: ABC transporter permease [Aliidongia sp.]|nr:ABC transporter permease [Aliidongia sp.]